jgi:hypothetical protein
MLTTVGFTIPAPMSRPSFVPSFSGSETAVTVAAVTMGVSVVTADTAS